MHESLAQALKRLRLSGLAQTPDVRLQGQPAGRLNHEEFPELVFQDEIAIRDERWLARRVKAASFRDTKRLEDFDWKFNPKVDRMRVFDFATGKFIREAVDVLWIGPPGTGRSHLCQAVGLEVIKRGYKVLQCSILDVVQDFLQDDAFGGTEKTLEGHRKPDLLIIDDIGLRQLPKRSGEYLFEIILRRYETRPTMMTSNRPIEEWGKLVGDVPTASAILDRFLHHAEVFAIQGKSYRLKDRAGKKRK